MLSKSLSSVEHPFVKYLVTLRTNRSFRRQEQKVLVMGQKMVEELAKANTLFEALIIESEKEILFPYKANQTYFVSASILKKITGIASPEPIAAIVSAPSFKPLTQVQHLLVLDGIADPGNLGTLLRTALALGWDGAFLLENTCDPFNDKALRAAKGATFRLPLQEGSLEEFLQLAKQENLHILIADKDGSSLKQAKKKNPIALVLSRESQGPRKELKECFEKISIPMEGDMESLNVASAGAILLYHLKDAL